MKTESGGWERFEQRMTVAIAMASGGVAIGTFFGGSPGGIFGAVVCGVAGFWLGYRPGSRQDDENDHSNAE